MNGSIPIVVATNAFGMGIDKSNIRFIIHYNLPGTLEAYYQEIGRAGRDSAQSRTILLYSDTDRGVQQYFIEESKMAELKLRELMHVMKEYRYENYLLIPHGELEEKTGLNETQIRVAISQMEKEHILQRLPDLSLELMVTPSIYGNLDILDEQDQEFYDDLLTLLGPGVENGIRSKLTYLSKMLKLPPDALEEVLLTLKFYNIVNFKSLLRGIALKLPSQRPQKSISLIAEGLNRIAEEKNGKLNSLIQYALTPVCRRFVLKEYFGEKHQKEKCGFCDNCRGGSLKVTLLDEMADDALPLRPLLELIETMRFPVGRNRLAEILSGSKKKDLIAKNFHLLPYYGELKLYQIKRVLNLINTAIRGGYIELYYRPDDKLHRFPLIKITSEGEELLQNEQPIYLQVDEARPFKKQKTLKRKGQTETVKPKKRKPEQKPTPKVRKQVTKIDLAGEHIELYEALKQWRAETARRLRTKAFMIFSNETLKLISQNRPQDFDTFLEIKGVGSVKLADYGPQILKIVSQFQAEDE